MSNFQPDDDYFSLREKKVVVLGIARQGKALGLWLPTQGASVILSDTRKAGDLADDLLDFITEPNVSFALGSHPVELLDDADMLCVSGGVSLDIPIVQAALERGIRVTNDATLFIERCPAPIVGITGSAGKTTTTTLIGEMGKLAGHTTWVGGNIGDVLIKDLDKIQREHLVVMELSSFQLELADVSPPIAVLLNVTPNHLDRHGTIEAYARAKANIFAHQDEGDILVYGHDDPVARALSEEARVDVVGFSATQLMSNGACLVGRRLVLNGSASPTGDSQVVCELDDIRLRGAHNIQNVLAACAVAGLLGIEAEVMQQVIKSFKGVPHRLEQVAVINGATWINDSIATSPERVIAALNSFEEPIVLLLGGRDKNLPWQDLAMLAVNKCRTIICFGEDSQMIAREIHRAKQALNKIDTPPLHIVEDLRKAVNFAAKAAHIGDVVLLSPGCTSYDAYRDFAERGDQFRELVNLLKRRT